VPANVAALVLTAPAGEELSCCAKNHSFDVGGKAEPFGIISHYAAKALISTTTFEEWRDKTVALCEADMAQKKLPTELRLSLTVAGQTAQRLPGTSKAR
jgi:hypothetical protein